MTETSGMYNYREPGDEMFFNARDYGFDDVIVPTLPNYVKTETGIYKGVQRTRYLPAVPLSGEIFVGPGVTDCL